MLQQSVLPILSSHFLPLFAQKSSAKNPPAVTHQPISQIPLISCLYLPPCKSPYLSLQGPLYVTLPLISFLPLLLLFSQSSLFLLVLSFSWMVHSCFFSSYSSGTSIHLPFSVSQTLFFLFCQLYLKTLFLPCWH